MGSFPPLTTLRLYPSHDYTIAGALRSRAAVAGDRPFLVCDGRAIQWNDVVERTERVARALAGLGVGAGDRVAIMARGSEQHVVLLAALAQLRAIMVPANPDFGPSEARYVFGHAGASVIVCDTSTIDTARAACAAASLHPQWLLLDSEQSDAPSLHRLAAEASSGPLASKATAVDTCVIIYTSGTSGFPKGVMHSQRSFLLTGEASVQRMQLQPDDRMLVVLAMFHVNALFYSIAGAIAAGCTAIVSPKFSASGFWRLAAETAATQVNVIEAMGSILTARPRTEFDSRHRIRKAYGVRAGAAETFRREFGIERLISGYGMTEAPGILSPEFDGLSKPGGMGIVGRHPDPAQPWAEVRVLDDERRDVTAGETGELAIRSPNLMQGYFRDPTQTAEAFHDGWFLTGDLVRRDADGYFFFVSRKKDIIRRRGENISGAELDRVIGEHPGVLEVAVIPVPSALGEDDILAAVVPRPNAVLGPEAIIGWCAARLAPAKVPRYVLLLAELPHTPTHKVAKAVLRADPSLVGRAFDRDVARRSPQAARG